MSNLIDDVKRDFKEFWELPILQGETEYHKTSYDSVNADHQNHPTAHQVIDRIVFHLKDYLKKTPRCEMASHERSFGSRL